METSKPLPPCPSSSTSFGPMSSTRLSIVGFSNTTVSSVITCIGILRVVVLGVPQLSCDHLCALLMRPLLHPYLASIFEGIECLGDAVLRAEQVTHLILRATGMVTEDID